jgi:hypothetical protein
MAATIGDVFEHLKKVYGNVTLSAEALDRVGGVSRKGHVVRTPLTEGEKRERVVLLKVWRDLTDELLERGFLDHAHCYECGGELEMVLDEETVSWEWDETEQEWGERLIEAAKNSPQTVTFKVHRREEQ